jgi:hypothetical protein
MKASFGRCVQARSEACSVFVMSVQRARPTEGYAADGEHEPGRRSRQPGSSPQGTGDGAARRTEMSRHTMFTGRRHGPRRTIGQRSRWRWGATETAEPVHPQSASGGLLGEIPSAAARYSSKLRLRLGTHKRSLSTLSAKFDLSANCPRSETARGSSGGRAESALSRSRPLEGFRPELPRS